MLHIKPMNKDKWDKIKSKGFKRYFLTTGLGGGVFVGTVYLVISYFYKFEGNSIQAEELFIYYLKYIGFFVLLGGMTALLLWEHFNSKYSS